MTTLTVNILNPKVSRIFEDLESIGLIELPDKKQEKKPGEWTLEDYPPGFPPELVGITNPNHIGLGKTLGDIVSPIGEEWYAETKPLEYGLVLKEEIVQ